MVWVPWPFALLIGFFAFMWYCVKGVFLVTRAVYWAVRDWWRNR